MRNIIVPIILLLFSINAFCQSDYPDTNASCTKTQSLTLEARLKKFPFDQSKQVIFTAFKNKDLGNVVGAELKTYLNNVAIGQTTFDATDFDEVVILNHSEIDSLTNIFYNYSYKKKPVSMTPVGCYEPRNAIIFVDDKATIIAFIEMCFGCNHFRSSHNKLDLGEYCSAKFDLIKEIFGRSGIKFGIIEE